jgi:hypothetical protein
VEASILALPMFDPEWLSAAALVALIALFLWRSGAPPRQIVFVAGIAALGIAATALFWSEALKPFD